MCFNERVKHFLFDIFVGLAHYKVIFYVSELLYINFIKVTSPLCGAGDTALLYSSNEVRTVSLLALSRSVS